MTNEQKKALADYQAALDAYKNQAPQQQQVQGTYAPQVQGDSALGAIQVDPRLRDSQLAALQAIEQQSREGFTAQDRAANARAEQDANRANRGRIGAIQQNMAARGMGGSGMDMVAQMQSSQSANELAAMRALEQEGLMQQRKAQAQQQLGQLSTQMQGQDFQQKAQQAQAADAIRRFNTATANDASQWGIQQRQGVANANAAANNLKTQGNMTAGTQGAGMAYWGATTDENRRLQEEEEKRKREAERRAAISSGIGAVAGGIAGSFGGPGGTVAGATAGSQVGGAVGGILPIWGK